ncbi:thyroid hormone-inducible hepatic protein [Anolis carolinensis]|nr:PREDICTED: thyroid hormone-inducible hepatic protein-like [Anolis carolinensis]|eukprot:XP_008116844.1 PREDICTED: thyroid hormone-inducible hepatic protein-like [Anolis carolinensis]
MEDYFAAVRKMEQTVMFPSLLLGVSLENQDDKDLHEYYSLLKSIKLAAEGGLKEKSLGLPEEDGKEEADLEGLFHFHVSCLHHILTRLTGMANTVTSKYNEIMGQIGQNEFSLRW